MDTRKEIEMTEVIPQVGGYLKTPRLKRFCLGSRHKSEKPTRLSRSGTRVRNGT
nr:MAG TPA: hypothetical protein [Caudoviricetes sp.]